MARYVDEYQETYGHAFQGRMDPNYRDGYHGMRMQGGRGQAAYGGYRWRHRGDLATQGGFEGYYDEGYRGTPGPEARYGRPRGYDREWRGGGGGGVHDPRYDREYLRDFNARSPALRRYGAEYGDRGEGRLRGEDAVRHREGYHPGYANRGLSSSGYSQPWLGTSRRG